MTDILERARRALAGVTPWSAADLYNDSCSRCRQAGTSEWNIHGVEQGHHGQFSDEEVARFIAAAPTLVRDLMAEVERLRGGRDGD